MKTIETINVDDFKRNPVWQYSNNDNVGETVIKPVKKIPVKNMAGKIIGTQVTLANGESVWAIIGNIDANNQRFTEHFITISIEKNGKWFVLARYHDIDYLSRGPIALSKFLGIDIDNIFPIAYDISKFVEGNILALSGKILKEPREKLSRSEIIGMAVP